MPEDNINKFIEQGFEENLFSSVSPDFAEKVMRQVELSKRFQAEDKKTFRIVNFLSVFLSVFITGAGVFLAYLIGKKNESSQTGFLTGTAETLENWLIKFFALLGLNLSENTIIYLLLVTVIIALFFIVEKYFSGKRAFTGNDSEKI